MPVRDLLNAASGTSAATYIEDVFSTYLYTGNGSTQSITNNIDLAGKGGMVWCKSRSNGQNNVVFDSARGIGHSLSTDRTAEEYTDGAGHELTSYNSNGFSLGTDYNYSVNQNTYTYASWTFRKQPKFFDVVTYTGNGTDGRAIPHSLTSTPGMIFVKCTSTTNNWAAWNRAANISGGGAGNASAYLNLTNAFAQDNGDFWGNSSTATYIAPTSTNFTVSTNINQSGRTFVAYLFAHNAGGFGAAGTDNVISCGSFTDNGTAVNLGYEPQFLLIKNTVSAGYSWNMFDNMRGITADITANDKVLYANTSAVETTAGLCSINATGFRTNGSTGQTHIYMAIRRPMKVPTDATTVFSPVAQNGASNSVVTTNFPVDLCISSERSRANFPYSAFNDRLRGGSLTNFVYLFSQTTGAEVNQTPNGIGFDNNTAIVDNWWTPQAGVTGPMSYWSFSRRPGFFDEVCYTGTGAATTQAHNLGVAPELIIVKSRSGVYNWETWSVYTTVTAPYGHDTLKLNLTNAAGATGYFPTDPTSSVFTISGNNQINVSGGTFVAYLFATCPGVSKVGSYTGNGTTQAIACGFTGGARFVLIKRTDSTGDWYVYDTARGMTTLIDPYLLLNSTAAEAATLGSVTTTAGGFTVNASILAAINTNAASYIFLAIA